jgi:hypothetical protein
VTLAARLLLAVVLLIPGGGCTASHPELPECDLDQCESAQSRDEVLAAIEGHQDPIATYLRQAVTEEGTLEGDYRVVADAVGAVIGCSAETEKSFVVLSNTGFIPKTIFTRCAEDPQLASQFFMAIPALHESDGETDVDPQVLHLSAWDEVAGTYRIYSTRPTEDGEMGVNVSPRFCLGCHGGPQQLPYWQPLMNEMTNPWSGWNAEPGFRSQLFDEFLDPTIAEAPVYRQIAGQPLLDSASNLEPIIRAGLDRVNEARLRARHGAADLERALALLQPLYCDETVNFVSEIHGTGEIRASAVVDPAIAAHMRALDGAVDWPWLSEVDLRLPAAPSTWEALTLIPVRGESTAATELSLVSRGVLAPMQALRVRALDWTHPVLSELRCGLFRAGVDRVRAGAIEAAIAALPAEATTADLVPIAYDEIMRFPGQDGLIDLSPPTGTDLIALADGTDAAALAQLARGELIPFAVSSSELGDRIQAHVDGIDRDALRAVRETRACQVMDEYPITPIYPDLDCD